MRSLRAGRSCRRESSCCPEGSLSHGAHSRPQGRRRPSAADCLKRGWRRRRPRQAQSSLPPSTTQQWQSLTPCLLRAQSSSVGGAQGSGSLARWRGALPPCRPVARRSTVRSSNHGGATRHPTLYSVMSLHQKLGLRNVIRQSNPRLVGYGQACLPSTAAVTSESTER